MVLDSFRKTAASRQEKPMSGRKSRYGTTSGYC